MRFRKLKHWSYVWVRWRYLLGPFAKVRVNRLYPVIMIGYMANNVLPMRLGELARSYYLSTREDVRGSTALANCKSTGRSCCRSPSRSSPLSRS